MLTQRDSKDQQHVYYMHHSIEGADPATYVVNSTAKDKNGSYSGRKRKEQVKRCSLLFADTFGNWRRLKSPGRCDLSVNEK